MSGQDVPYQLRPNKFVERQLFLDILDFVRVWNGPSKYLYAAMGGRFLEDFKQINDRFAIEHMISIENDKTTWKRQEFNRLGFIECLKQKSGVFVDRFDRLAAEHSDKCFVVWLDFTEANKRGKQLGEFRQLVSKLSSGDVAKITLNANSQSYRRRASVLTKKDFDSYLRDPESPTHKDFDTYLSSIVASSLNEGGAGPERSFALTDSDYEAICIENLKTQLGEYLPTEDISPSHLESDAFAGFLAESVKIAALKGVEGAGLQVIPLGAFRYRDGEHQMLTVTSVIADKELVQRISSDRIFAEWPFRASHWSEVQELCLPDVSAKERNHIDGLITLNHKPDDIHNEIPFRFDEDENMSLSLLAAYLKNYRRYPTFVRIP
ncbi:MAG: hypothetical protein NT013_05745 [Planctomycetia bacterium]|nr:hypothetical protein [Planctomycetia bacterium]